MILIGIKIGPIVVIDSEALLVVWSHGFHFPHFAFLQVYRK